MNASPDRYADVELSYGQLEIVALDGMPLSYHDPNVIADVVSKNGVRSPVRSAALARGKLRRGNERDARALSQARVGWGSYARRYGRVYGERSSDRKGPALWAKAADATGIRKPIGIRRVYARSCAGNQVERRNT